MSSDSPRRAGASANEPKKADADLLRRRRQDAGKETMETFVQELVNSLSVASVIILMGIGVTLIFGLTGIINFAHGEFLMLGGMGVWVFVSNGIGYVPALLMSVALVALLGLLLERGLFQFTLAHPNNGFMASLGLQIVIQHVV